MSNFHISWHMLSTVPQQNDFTTYNASKVKGDTISTISFDTFHEGKKEVNFEKSKMTIFKNQMRSSGNDKNA